MREHYATSFQTGQHCAAYRRGVLTIVRLKDGQSCTLSLLLTNEFKRNVMQFELEDNDADPVDRACGIVYRFMKPNKYVRALYEGAIIQFDPEPIKVEP